MRFFYSYLVAAFVYALRNSVYGSDGDSADFSGNWCDVWAIVKAIKRLQYNPLSDKVCNSKSMTVQKNSIKNIELLKSDNKAHNIFAREWKFCFCFVSRQWTKYLMFLFVARFYSGITFFYRFFKVGKKITQNAFVVNKYWKNSFVFSTFRRSEWNCLGRN